MGTLLEALAKRVEQGAKSLAQFAETLSDAEWRSTVAPDGRQVGVKHCRRAAGTRPSRAVQGNRA